MDTYTNALEYAQRGFAVFPLIQRTKIPAKNTQGLKDASKLVSDIQEMWGDKKLLNIAIATGEVSDIFVVDLDGKEGIDNFNAKSEEMGGVPNTLTVKTGKGFHLYFRYPGPDENGEILDLRNSTSKIADKVDVRANGGYVVAPPSIHPDGSTYTWANPGTPIAQAPQWIIDEIKREKEAPLFDTPRETYHHNTAGDYNWTSNDVQQMLSYLDPDMAYQDWLSVGMALHQGGYPLEMWDSWSKDGSKYKPGCCIVRWRGFSPNDGITMGSLVSMAQLHGWQPEVKPHDPTNVNGIDISQFLKNVQRSTKAMTGGDKKKTESPSSDDKDDKIDILFQENLPQPIRRTIEWINESAIKPQPELALMNTLTALGAVYGRFYATEMNTRTNLYMIGVAKTGAGKDHSRRQIKNLMAECGLESRLGGDTIISAPGVVMAMKEKPSQIMHLDEFGMLLKGMADDKAPAYLKAISKTLTEMYSTSGSTYHGGTYADDKKAAIMVQCPHLCIYGTTTPEVYIDALSRSAVTSGELNRYVIFPSLQSGKRRRKIINIQPPQDIVDTWKFLGECPVDDLSSTNGADIKPTTILVSHGDTDERIYKLGLFEDEMAEMYDREGTAPLWGRYRENCIKIAMILAITRQKNKPVISHEDLDFAESLVKSSVQYMRSIALEHMADTQHERHRQTILNVIKANGNEISRTDLFKNIRSLPKRDIDSILSTFIEAQIIQVYTPEPQGKGRPGTSYRII